MNGTKTRLRHVVAMFSKHPCMFVVGLLSVFAAVCTWYLCRAENISLFPIQRPLFPRDGNVHEIIDGSLDALSEFIDHGSLKFVLYYAPWCGQSKRAVPEFIHVADKLHQEVTFIAINCWSGPCRKEYQLEYFPQIVAYHTIFPGVPYPDTSDVQSLYMLRFLENILRPFSYIGREHEIFEARETNQEVILSYINGVNTREYKRFFGAALEYVGKVSKPFFGVVLNVDIATKIGLKTSGQFLFYRTLETTLSYHPKSNSLTKNMTKWISKHRKQIIAELIPMPSQKQVLQSKLNDKPAVILFLPVPQQNISMPLLSMYTRIATDYNNCTCINTTKTNPKMAKSHSKAVGNGLPTLVNPKDIQPSSTLYNGHDSQTKTGISCKSFLVENKLKIQSVCDSCCTVGSHCHLMDFNIFNHLQRNEFTHSCWSLRPNLVTRANVCCYGGLPMHGYKERLKKKLRFTSDKVFAHKLDSFLDSFYNQFLNVLEPLQRNMNDKVEQVSGMTKGIPTVAHVVSTNNSNHHGNGSLATQLYNITSDGCNRTGHVVQFYGASCHSNRSVNFFYMDSERFWGVAKRLGVNGSTKNKACLVIVDVKNEAYHVMSGDLPVTNQSIVQFIMEFMNSRLERTFQSAAATSHTCPKSQACVLEVTSATLGHIVMDNDKDVLLAYYAPWCGFCINLAPVLLTVARFFKDFKNVVIARIDADQNDLPWQHTVTSYPTIILYPATRKDFSVRFPDTSKRTAQALIRFILQHGTKAALFALYGKADRCSNCDSIKDTLHQLETSLRRVEDEKQFLGTRLERMVMEKSLLKLKHLKLIKGLHNAQRKTADEKESRIAMETKVKEAEESRRETNDRNLILVLRNAQLETELSQLKGELQENRQKSSVTLKEIQQAMDLKDEMEEANEFLVKKLDLAVTRINELQKLNKVLSSKARRLRTTQNTFNNRLTRTSIENYKCKKAIVDLSTEKRTLSSLLKDSAATIKSLKTSLASFEKRLGVEEEKRNTAIRRHQEASDKLKEMETNYEKLTVILSQIDKKQQLS